MIVVNSIRCKKCGDVITSLYRDDRVKCRCGQCEVFGGREFLGRSTTAGSIGDAYDDLTVFDLEEEWHED